MKFAEIRLHDSAPDASGAQTATFRNVDADVEPWGLWVGSLLLPWGSIRYARREHVKLDAMGSWTVPSVLDPRLMDEAAAHIRRPGGVPSVIAIPAEDLARLREGVSPHDVEQFPAPGSMAAAVSADPDIAPEPKRKRGRKPAP